MWDQRYAADEYVYGTLPNDFLVSRVAALPRGRELCLGDGAVVQVLARRPA